MTIDNWDARMAAVAAAFANAPDEGSSNFDPPIGEHQAIVDGWEHFESNPSNGSPSQAFIKCVTKIVNSQQAGRHAELVHSLEDPDRIGYLKETLVKLGAREVCTELGWNFDDPAVFPHIVAPASPVLRRLLDTPVAIKVVQSDRVRPQEKGGGYYFNVYLQQRLGAPGSARRAQPVEQQQMPVGQPPVQPLAPGSSFVGRPLEPSPPQYQSDVTPPNAGQGFVTEDPFAAAQQIVQQEQQQAQPAAFQFPPNAPAAQQLPAQPTIPQQMAAQPQTPAGPPQPGSGIPLQATNDPDQLNLQLRAYGCVCPDFARGQTADACKLPGHGIPF